MLRWHEALGTCIWDPKNPEAIMQAAGSKTKACGSRGNAGMTNHTDPMLLPKRYSYRVLEPRQGEPTQTNEA